MTAYDLPTFLGEPLAPIELVSELAGVSIDGAAATLRCRTLRFSPMLHNYYGTQVETVLTPPVPGVDAIVQLDFLTDAIIRLRFAPGTLSPDAPSPMIVGQFEHRPQVEAVEHERGLTLSTSSLRVEIVREPFQVRIFDAGGREIWQTRALDIEGLRRPEVQWNPTEQRWIFYHRYAYPLGSLVDGQRRRAFCSLDLRHDEHIYGFGESFGRLDKRETMQALWIQEGFGNASPASYKRAPFYMSTRGYGLFIHTANAVRCRVGDLEHTALSMIVDDTCELDLFICCASKMKDILPLYTSITGAPAVPPLWTFGLWVGRISYNRQAQVETVAAELRAHEIPCDVIHIDTDWYRRDWECDLEFCPEKFPDPAGMMARLREQGLRVCLWQWPNMVVTSRMFHEALEHGFLAKRVNGQPYLFPGFQPDAGFIDYSNPAAVDWIKGKFRRLFELGVAAIKVDFGEGAPPDAVYHSLPSEAAHSLYPLLYSRAIYEVTEETQGPGRAVVWARAAWAGSQRYPVHWSGDGIARYEDLACVLRAALSFGLSGFPFYSHDIGGFSGLPSPELYVRWAQLAFFGSHVRAHGTPPREPWAFGSEAERIFRDYDALRYRLLPYIYSEAVECGRSSLPMMRALALDFQDDPTAVTIDDQYMFGRSLLVAPVLDAGTQRRVYLPRGVWFDYWTKEPMHGGHWFDVEAPLDRLPLYVRGGAIIPYAPLAQHTGALRLDPLTVEVYDGENEARFSLQREQEPPIVIRFERINRQLQIEIDPAPGAVDLTVYGFGEHPHRAQFDGRAGVRTAVD